MINTALIVEPLEIRTNYPQVVLLADGSKVQMTEDDWRRRRLVVETNMDEREVRRAFEADGFRTTVWEIVKDGQIGHGMVKKFEYWQTHVRFYRHGNRIQIDGEVEVSNAYMEHLVHGWISGYAVCADVIGRYFGRFWAYHRGYGEYVSRIIAESALVLREPASKTSVVGLAILVAIAGALVAAALRGR